MNLGDNRSFIDFITFKPHPPVEDTFDRDLENFHKVCRRHLRQGLRKKFTKCVEGSAVAREPLVRLTNRKVWRDQRPK